MNVVWSEQARISLSTIYDYIYEDNPEAANKVLNTLLSKADSLSDPRIEYPKDPIVNNPKYRFILQWNFKIIYESTDKRVIIIDIFHTRQDPGKLIF